MVNVFLTVDVEIWCGGWDRLDERFPESFRRYIYGPTSKGNYGLPLKLKILGDHGLKGVFFVEPLFATKFGMAPLQEIIGLIQEAGQEIQLHLHTEWIDESTDPILSTSSGKRQFLKSYSLDEQTVLIKTGSALLKRAGCHQINAFRAGNFGANDDTLRALSLNDIAIDSSYNLTAIGGSCAIDPGRRIFQPYMLEGVYEYPITVFEQIPGSFRHVQLGSCSHREIISLLNQAQRKAWNAFVILSHNFELLNQSKIRPDPIVTNRFIRLCKFLDDHRDSFSCVGFSHRPGLSFSTQPDSLKSNLFSTSRRMTEQVIRRIYR